MAAPSAAATAQRIAAVEAQFQKQVELVERRAAIAVATARREAREAAEAAGQRALEAQEQDFRKELAELEAQAERALTRSASTEHELDRLRELDELCGAQADTIQRLQGELAELGEAAKSERRSHERVLAAKAKEWEVMEKDFMAKIMAVDTANRRGKKLAGALELEQQRLQEAEHELETVQESLETLSRAASVQEEDHKGLLDDRLRAQLQARIVATGRVHAQLLVDGQLWASANFTAASMDGDLQDQDIEMQPTPVPPLPSSSGSPPRPAARRRVEQDLERELELERSLASEEIQDLREEVRELRHVVTESQRELQQVERRRDDAVAKREETEERAERWIRKIHDARAEERAAHENDLAESEARREAAEGKLHNLWVRFGRTTSGRTGSYQDADQAVAGWMDGAGSVVSTGSAPTHLAGLALQQAAMAPRQPQRPPRSGRAWHRETNSARRRSIGEVVERADRNDNLLRRESPEPERVAASSTARPSAKRRGTDRVARPGKAGSPLRPTSPVCEMPNWQSVVQATQKLHAERASAAAASGLLSDVDESESASDFSVQAGSAARRRGGGSGRMGAAADRADAAAAALDAELEAASEASGSEVGRRRREEKRPEGGGRWAARAAAARRRRT